MKDPTVPLPPPALFDVGWGTAYERWAVYGLLRRWLETWTDVATALEGPVDGMAGIPGLHLLPVAEKGALVTVIVPTEAAAETVRGVYRGLGLEGRLDLRTGTDYPEGESFDLVLSYNALPCLPRWEEHLDSGARCARRFFVVSVTHRSSYGVLLRRALRLLEPGQREAELFDHPSTDPRLLEPLLARWGRILADAYVDCPWWPDLFVPTGETLVSGTLGRLPFGKRLLRGARAAPARAGEPFVYGPGRFPLLGGEGFAEEVAPALRRHPVFDGAPRPVAAFFAHHRVRAVERS